MRLFFCHNFVQKLEFHNFTVLRNSFLTVWLKKIHFFNTTSDITPIIKKYTLILDSLQLSNILKASCKLN